MTWLAVGLAAAGCLALKLLGWSVPARLLTGDRLRRGTERLPVALLAGLVVVQAIGGGDRSLLLDARVAGLGVAALALLLRAPFLVVVVAAAATAAVLRAL